MRSARPQAGHYSSSANRGAGGYSDFGDLVTCPAGTYRRANASSAGNGALHAQQINRHELYAL
eukprot:1620593-Pleurochrysis_carterae.AAC.2